ncbi:hypothetical protein [Eubacterium barkeri]|uniref:Cobalamin biosynthesis protein CobT VWA domain-containing protein n=1 Tax=Eubacterium barkeri TaxID=1528 RepID=A0A1H3EX25_EUBBA|nr:hypothetical protein [Eubacterium barkeri]SDX83281.1 hypothetical protein SAMN04488579_10883 [Eubacterium barkeri]
MDLKVVGEKSGDLDTRIKNMFWTICGDYQMETQEAEITGDSEAMALYQAVLAGGRQRFLDRAFVAGYTGWRLTQGFERKSFLAVLHWGLNLYIIHQFRRIRPGVVDIQGKACRELIQCRVPSVNGGFDEALDQRMGSILAGMPGEGDGEYSRLAEDLIKNAKTTDQLACLEGIDRLYQEFFGLRAIPFSRSAVHAWTKPSGSGIIPFGWEAPKQKAPGPSRSKNSAESQRHSVGREHCEQKEGALEDAAQQVVHHYGASWMPLNTTRAIETRWCIGPHRDCHLHYTRGLLHSDTPGENRGHLAQRNTLHNRTAYEKKREVYEAIITRLRASICNALMNKRECYEVQSDYGSVDVRRLWRLGRVPAPRLFRRPEGDDQGDYVVDLLIDGSFSQVNKRSVTAIQAYIIARALVENGIPCRVTSFCGFLDYTVLQRFRDYEDPIPETDHIFEYDCVGSNRDGLAIPGICDALLKRFEENKILIVLSDGRPNDIHLGGRAGPFRGMGVYSGEAAVGDTAKAVRRARQQGISVLGVYCGEPKDLAAEQKIYGNQFIYIRDKRCFADVVSVYLKRVIAG